MEILVSEKRSWIFFFFFLLNFMSSADDPFANCFFFFQGLGKSLEKMKIKPSHLNLLSFLFLCR